MPELGVYHVMVAKDECGVDGSMNPGIYWYDYETTGTDPARDRAIQFAGVRTDADLQVTGSPLNLFCQPGNDILPDPDAMLVTGIRMSALIEQGLTETDFIGRIHAEFARPGTCVAGFNSIRFDDEFTRYSLYRNFLDPYAREWQHDNSRWDVIDLFRMAHALRPEGMSWPQGDDGAPVFRLEALTRANAVGHEDAHDAVADVMATVNLVRKQRRAQPKLYDYLFNLRRKQAVIKQLYPLGKTAMIHVSSMYPASRHCLAVVLPICSHPANANGVICYDLAFDPAELIALGPDELHHRLFTATDDLAEGEARIHLKTVHVNRCPAIAPLATLRKSDATRLGVDLDACERHRKALQGKSGMVEKIQDAFTRTGFVASDDPDLMLYSGDFFSARDRANMLALRGLSADELRHAGGTFDDWRVDEMLFRYRARNYPHSLDKSELERWNRYRAAAWQAGRSPEAVLARIDELLASGAAGECLTDLKAYVLARRAEVETV